MITPKPVALVGLCLAVGFLSACSAEESSNPSVSPGESVPTTGLDPTTLPSTIVAAATTSAPTTVPVPPAFLRSDGIGSSDFGTPYASFDLGSSVAPAASFDQSFPVAEGDSYGAQDAGGYITHFSYPMARVACFDDGVGGTLCAYFGGVDIASLVLVGWDYSGDAGVGALYSASGLTVNELASDMPVIPVPHQGCPGYAIQARVEVDGIVVILFSDSLELLGSVTPDGVLTPADPQPSGVRISAMQSGERILTGGCND
ncbi:hypothetical protein BH10ACT2_BH10ACT2_11410 [soil metagenome]